MNVSSTDRIDKAMQLKAPVARVWRALTDYKEFGAWFRVNLEGPLVAGKSCRGQLTFPTYEHVILEIEVVAIERERLFSFKWHPYAVEKDVDYSSETPTLVEFHLEPSAIGTLLKLSESGFDAVPAERRDEAFRMNDSGWVHQMLNIEKHLGGG